MGRKIVMADKVVEALQRSGVVDLPSEYLTRVVIDLRAGDLPMIYTEQVADERLIDVLLHAGLDDLPRTLPVEAWRPPNVV